MCREDDMPESTYDPTVGNKDLVPEAGKVALDAGQPCARGLCSELKRTLTKNWLREVKVFNQKTVGVTMLMFISVVAPTLAFGASYGKASNNYIGTIETILCTAYTGMIMSAIGGMPMIIIGSTGPMLAISTAVYSMAESFDVPILTFNGWCSIWLLVYVVICVFFDLTRFAKLATRFTDDIFAFLVVSIFVIGAVGNPFTESGLLYYLSPNDASHEELAEDNTDYNFWATGFLSVLLGFGTTWLIFWLRTFKSSTFFTKTIREMIFDFSVITAVIVATVVDKVIFNEIPTESLNVPESFEPTFQCCDSSCTTSWPDDCPDQSSAAGTRPWFVNLGDLNGKGWVPIVAAGPALLAFLGNYLDNGITWHLIVNPNHKLQCGEAYNYDLLINGLLNCISGLLGCPWLVASTVPCITHLNALATRDKDNRILFVQETRWTNFLAHLILLCFAFASSVLKLIPLPVLLGVFLFMGLSALPNIQFWQRILQFIRQPSLYDDTPYNKYMTKARVHKYTLLQILFFTGVFVVQRIKVISIAFPFMTCLCIPARLFLFPKFFEGWELELLDGEDSHIDAWVAAKESRRKSILFGADSDDEDDEMELGLSKPKPAVGETVVGDDSSAEP